MCDKADAIVELIYRGYIKKVSELVDKLTCSHENYPFVNCISFHIQPQLSRESIYSYSRVRIVARPTTAD